MPLVYDDEQTSQLVYDDESIDNNLKSKLSPTAETVSKFLTSQETTNPLVPDVRTPLNPYQRIESLRIPEKLGSEVKRVAQESLSNIARTPTQNIATKTAGLGTLSTLTDAAPFTPSEFISQIGGEILPGAAMDAAEAIPVLKQIMPKAMMNRFLKQKEAPAAERLRSGEPPLGESALASEIVNPEGFGQLPSGDAKQVYNRAGFFIKKIGNNLNKRINEISGNEKLNINSYDLGRKEAVDNVIDDFLGQQQKYGLDDKNINLLKRVKNNENLDLKTLNDFREFLGSEINKKFNNEFDANAPSTQAAIGIFAKARQLLGRFAPDVDSMLQKQHLAYEVQGAVQKRAAAGYENLSKFSDLYRIGADAITANPKIAGILKSIAEARGYGAFPAISSQQRFENLKKNRQEQQR